MLKLYSPHSCYYSSSLFFCINGITDGRLKYYQSKRLSYFFCPQWVLFSCCILTCVSGLTSINKRSSPELNEWTATHTHLHTNTVGEAHFLCVNTVHCCFLLNHTFSLFDYRSLIHQTHLLTICLHSPSPASLRGVALMNYSAVAFRDLCPCGRTHIWMCVS